MTIVDIDRTIGKWINEVGGKLPVSNDWHLTEREAVPNFSNDLNAMYVAEEILMIGSPLWDKYCLALGDEVGFAHWRRELIHATAAQRAKAFVMAIRRITD